MKKIIKFLTFFLIFLNFSLFGVDSFVDDSNSEPDNDFEIFSQQIANMIGTSDVYTDDKIVFDRNNDLYIENNTLMVESEKFVSLTGSFCYSSNFETYTISKLEQKVELTPDNNIVTKNNNEIIYMPEPMRKECNDISFAFEDISMALGYEIKDNDDKIILTRPFSSKRLIIKSYQKIDELGAIKTASGFENLYVFQYKTESEAIKAYEYYSELDVVEWVEPDRLFSTQDIDEKQEVVQGLQDTYSYTTWGADAMGVDNYSQHLLNTIGNVNSLNNTIIAVIDTGIDSDHEWFNNRILYNLGRNFSSSVSKTSYEFEDVHGHGTHVAGTICDITLSNVKILPIKVMNDQGYGYASQIMLGINYVTQLKQSGQRIVAMNLSLGSANGVGSNEHNMYTTALTNAYNSGIMPVVAAGNDGTDVVNHTPANIDFVLTVSAVGVSGNLYYKPSWSNYGSYIDVCAPGQQIVSACVGGGTAVKSGTSMAAPHVAGVIGLLMSGHNYSLSQLENIIDENVIDLGESGWDSFYGEGFVNIEYAFADLINDVEFSNKNVDCTAPFNLTLTSDEANAQIYYTKDETTPTLNNGILYTSPFLINATQKIKARAYVISNGNVVKYSKVSEMTYCLYSQDIADSFVVSADGVLTSYDGVLTEIIVPKQVNGITITSIGANAFTSSNVTVVTLPSTVTTIGAYAFSNCSTIQTVYGPNVKTIGLYAFNNCSQYKNLTDVYFPELLTIGKYAFSKCYNLMPITLSRVTKIDYWAFDMNSGSADYLTSITLPEAKIIAEGAFIYCKKLTSINIPSAEIIASNAFMQCDIRILDLPSAKYLGNKSFFVNKNLTSINLPEAEIIGASTFYYYCTKVKTITIPKVRIIAESAFRLCSDFTYIDMPEVEEVGSYAFNECKKLASLSAPKLKYIGHASFGNCEMLKVVNLPKVVSIGQYAFRMISGLTSVTLSSCLEEIGDESFYGTSKTTCLFSVYGGTVGEAFVVSQGYNYVDLLTSCNDFIYEIHFDEVYITGYKGENITNLVIPSFIEDKPVVKISSSAFKNNSYIQTISISQVIEIGDEAFSGCINLTQLNLPRIESIGEKAFYNCEKLSDIDIIDVKNLGNQAFYGCSSLLSIKFSDRILNIGNQALGYSADAKKIPTFVIYGYDESAAEAYANAENITFRAMFSTLDHFYYNSYINNGKTELYISFIDSFMTGNIIVPGEYNKTPITKIGEKAFNNCSFITGVILPSSIKTIGESAFKECTLLCNINLDNVTSIGKFSFGGCSSLKELNAPLLENISSNAFNGCYSLISANIPNARLIEEGAFINCYKLKKVVSPSLEIIQKTAFTYDFFLESIDTQNLRVIGTKNEKIITSSVFAYCENLKSIYLPNIEEIGDATFSESGVQFVVIGKNFYNYYSKPIDSSITIYGYSGSYAHVYATEKGNQFIPIEEFNISSDLPSSKQVDKEQSLTLSVVFSGFEQSYQWYQSTSNSFSNGVAMNGMNTNSLVVDTSQVGTFYYYVNVKNWDNEKMSSRICAVKVMDTINVFNITATSSENGSISPSGNVEVVEGGNQKFTFVANTGYHLSSLIIDGVAVNSNELANLVITGYSFSNVNKAHTISANYEINTYRIEIIQTNHGSISNSVLNYNYGSNATFTITADIGYSISKLVIDNIEYSYGDLSAYTFANIHSNHTLSALFAANIDTAYKVNYFLESLSSDGAIYSNGTYYLLKESENLSGETNVLTNIIPKSYNGFSNLEIVQQNISADGSAQVNVYYNRNSYSVSIIEGIGIDATSGNGNYKFEEEVVINADTNLAYNWQYWTSDNLVVFPTITDKKVVFKMPALNLSLTANAIIKSFEITTIINGNGTIFPGTSTINYGESQEFVFLPNTGYKVGNVVVDGVDLNEISFYTFSNIISQHTISVQFERAVYVVTFDTNGGILKSGELTQSVAYESDAIAPTLEKTGYTHNGWDLPLNNITTNTTITAQWKIINYDITYYLNEGINNENNPITYNIESEKIELENATKTGHNFIGWFSDMLFTGEQVEFINKGSVGNLKLYAKFERAVYVVTFDTNGGILKSGELTQSVAYESDAIAPTLEKTGYTHNGWDLPLNNITTNTTITAQWKIINYDITYYLNEGINNENNPITYNIESEKIVLENATKTGHNFIGWFSDMLFTGEQVEFINKGSVGNLKLYAKFEAKKYSIVFDLNSSKFGDITCDNADLNNLHYGDEITITVTPDAGYEIDKLYANGSEKQLNGNQFTISNIGEDVYIAVSYKVSTISPSIDLEGDEFKADKNNYSQTKIFIIIGAVVIVLPLLVLAIVLINQRNSKKRFIKRLKNSRK